MNKPDYRLELMWSTFPCKSLTKGFGNDWLQAGAGLHYFPLQIPYEELWKGRITDWSCSEAPSLTNPLRKGLITDSGWSGALSFTNPWCKGLIVHLSCSEAFSLTNPWRNSWELQVRDDYIWKIIQKSSIKVWLSSGKPKRLDVTISWSIILLFSL